MSRTAFAIIASTIILASVATMTVTASAVVSAESATYGFVLRAKGEAYDSSGRLCKVDLSLIGTGYGSPTSIMSLRVESGTIEVVGYGKFCVIEGEGMLVQANHYIYVNIRITPVYGGPATKWDFRGTTGEYHDNKIPLSLSSRYVVLPTSPVFTILYRLELEEEVTFS